ncbi:carotenoid biosynthesis protein [Litoribacter ruber]|uniref:carotenoid biosynthesis protein n=1 Tax=Litoribacter ruber TaxID=702568 RepID=UPI001BDB551B|nr:carotenoid biosynthesis protein [Litoribacter ruber]MBT0812553.1 carotenoid biosynthesis protein [Litoribacter ruber]
MPLSEVKFTSRPVLKNLGLWKIITVLLYGVGIIGMSIPDLRPIFQFLTPFHLAISTFSLLLFHAGWNKNFIVFAIGTFLIGFLAEVLGVQTGILFGEYIYGPVLGIQLWGVPLMIGVNWFLLTYLTGNLAERYIANDFLAALGAAFMMVGLDILIEPVAVALDFWQWEGGVIPISNYLGWLGVAFLLQLFYKKAQFPKQNPLAMTLLLAMTFFFGVLAIIL